MIAITVVMIPSTRSSAPTAIPISLEHMHGHGASDDSSTKLIQLQS